MTEIEENKVAGPYPETAGRRTVQENTLIRRYLRKLRTWQAQQNAAPPEQDPGRPVRRKTSRTCGPLNRDGDGEGENPDLPEGYRENMTETLSRLCDRLVNKIGRLERRFAGVEERRRCR
jgi:hypothetical protein